MNGVYAANRYLQISLLGIYNDLFAIKDLVLFLSFHAEKLLELLREDLSLHNQRTVVFCNTTPSCDFIGHYLTNNGISHIKLHSTIAIEVEELRSSLSLAQTYPVGMGLQTFHDGGGGGGQADLPSGACRPSIGGGQADLPGGDGHADLPSGVQGVPYLPLPV